MLSCSSLYNFPNLRSYDRFYQTPRMWLSGYSESDKPLTNEQTYRKIEFSTKSTQFSLTNSSLFSFEHILPVSPAELVFYKREHVLHFVWFCLAFFLIFRSLRRHQPGPRQQDGNIRSASAY